MKNLINYEYIRKLDIPRKAFLFWFLLLIILEAAAIFIWSGIFIIFSCFLFIVLLTLLYFFIKVWIKYYSIISFFILWLAATAVIIYLKMRLSCIL